MKRALFILALLCPVAFSQQGPLQGTSTLGGISATTQGAQSSNKLMGVIPAAKISIYLTGTTTLATLTTDGTTSLSNPFYSNSLSASNPGGWIAYAATGYGYDVVASSGQGAQNCTTSPLCYTAPVTLCKDCFPSQAGGGSGGGVSQIVAGSNISISPSEGTGVVTINSTGGRCAPSGSFGPILVDNGDGTCISSDAVWDRDGATYNFGQSSYYDDNTFSCDGDTCTITTIYPLNDSIGGGILIASGWRNSPEEGCFTNSGYVSVLSHTTNQIVINEGWTSCTGSLSGTGGILLIDIEQITASGISIGGSFDSQENTAYAGYFSLHGTSFYSDIKEDPQGSETVIEQNSDGIDILSHNQSLADTGITIGASPSGGVQGHVDIKTPLGIDISAGDAGLYLYPDAQSTLNVPGGLNITGANGTQIANMPSTGGLTLPDWDVPARYFQYQGSELKVFGGPTPETVFHVIANGARTAVLVPIIKAPTYKHYGLQIDDQGEITNTSNIVTNRYNETNFSDAPNGTTFDSGQILLPPSYWVGSNGKRYAIYPVYQSGTTGILDGGADMCTGVAGQNWITCPHPIGLNERGGQYVQIGSEVKLVSYINVGSEPGSTVLVSFVYLTTDLSSSYSTPTLLSFSAPVLGPEIQMPTKSASAPTTLAWSQGDMEQNSGATANGVAAWVNTGSGTPGTWAGIPLGDTNGKIADTQLLTSHPLISGTPTVGAGVCWKTTTTLGTCTAGTWPNCTTCN